MKNIEGQHIKNTLMNTLMNLMYYPADNQWQLAYVIDYQLMNTLHYITIYIASKSVMYYIAINQHVADPAQKPLNVFPILT